MNYVVIFAPTITAGDVAQSVEQRTENPCVGGSIPSITTKGSAKAPFFLWYVFRLHDTKPEIGSDLRWYGKGRCASPW